MGAKETITSGKKKDPCEEEKKGRRSDYRGKGTRAAERGRREGKKGRRKGQREKGKLTPRGKCPNRSTHCTALPPQPPPSPSSIHVVLSVRFSLCAGIGECRSGVRRSVRGALSLLGISVAPRLRGPHYNKS